MKQKKSRETASSSSVTGDSLTNSHVQQLLKRYFRRSACSAAAGVGFFGLSSAPSEAAINFVDPPDYELTGNPIGPYYGTFGWSDPYGLDLDQNGSVDVGFFRGFNYYGYLIARDQTEYVGYNNDTGYNTSGSGQVTLLTNFNNADTYLDADALQGFNAGEVIGDDEVSVTPSNPAMRAAYQVGDWDGVPTNYGQYPYNTGSDVSYVGFEIDLDNDTTPDGFGWIEVIVRETAWNPAAPTFISHPELIVTRWAYTDDGSTIEAGETGLADSDFNEDGNVNGLDFLIWQRGVGVGTTKAEGDADGNGVVDAVDLGIWESEYGATPLQGAGGVVPEPSSLALLAAGAGAYAFRRRRRD